MKCANSKSRARKSAIGLTMICPALLWICSCTPAKTVVKTDYVYVTPPAAYMQTYPVPELTGEKNRDLLMWALDLAETARMHNQDKRALQEWKAGIPEKEGKK